MNGETAPYTSRTTPADVDALERLRAELGGELRTADAATLERALVGVDHYAATILTAQVRRAAWIEAQRDGFRVAVISGLNRHVEYANFEARQAVAVFLPESPIASLLHPTRVRAWLPFGKKVKEHEMLHLFFAFGVDAQYTWRVDGAPPPDNLPSGYAFVGCLDAVLYAAIDAKDLDVEKARAALADVLALARRRWRPPTPEEIDAARRKNNRGFIVALLITLAVAVVVLLLNLRCGHPG